MGRIDDALRRAGAENPADALPAPAAKGAFVAPWTFDAGAEASPVAEAHPESAASDPTLIGEAEATVDVAFSRAWKDRLAISESAKPELVEQFRSLAAALLRLRASANLKVVMVTSAEPGDGKTFVAVNLALVLSESYRRRVLLVDADLRRPSIREFSEISDRPGLSEALKARADQKLSVLRISETLTLLPAGRPDPDPMSGLTSARMKHIVNEAAARFDWVVLDVPPMGPVPDASLLAGMTDGTLLVVRAGQTPCAAVQKAIEGLGRDRILGVVLNGADYEGTTYYGGYYGRSGTAETTR